MCVPFHVMFSKRTINHKDEFAINKSKLAHYNGLEEQGRLVELPCKLRDIVYQIVKCSDGITRIFEMKVCNINQYGCINHKNGNVWNCYLEDKDSKSYCSFYDFGTTVFLTREEAERELEEMKNER